MADASLSAKPSNTHLFYTYIHRRADDGKVFYVGKGQRNRSHSIKGRTARWIRTAAKHGLIIEIVATFERESDALDHEKALIAKYRAEGPHLCNLTDGGEGTSGYKYTEEQRRKNAERGMGRKQSAETIAKRVARLVGLKRSDEARAKISAGRIGIKPSAHCVAMVKAANTGIVRSAEFRAKVSAGLTGRPCSAETREKIAAGNRGKIISQEQRDKISKTLAGRRLSDDEKLRLYPMTHSPEIIAKRSAAMKGRKLSEAHRSALRKPWSEAARIAHKRTQP